MDVHVCCTSGPLAGGAAFVDSGIERTAPAEYALFYEHDDLNPIVAIHSADVAW
jgi:hypothetical protein